MKRWFQSKLIWTGFAAVLTAVYSAIETGMDWKAAAFAGLGAIVVVLRAITDTSIAGPSDVVKKSISVEVEKVGGGGHGGAGGAGGAGGIGGILSIGFVVLFANCAGCASIPKIDSQTAVEVGCTVADLGGCFDDSAVQAAFPGIDKNNCPGRVQYLKDLATGAIAIEDADSAFIVLDKIDLSKVNMPSILELKRASCRKLKTAMGL